MTNTDPGNKRMSLSSPSKQNYNSELTCAAVCVTIVMEDFGLKPIKGHYSIVENFSVQ